MTTTHSKTKSTTSTVNSTSIPLFATDYRVYINHTDAGGIVYHANHLTFFENCRRDWFTELGLNGYFLQADDGQIQHFVVSQAQLNYRQAIVLDEVISVRIDKVELKPASIIFYQSIHRRHSESKSLELSKATNTVLSDAKIVIACVQNQVKPKCSGSQNDSSNHASSVDPVANAVPIRPIRVPNQLRDMIQYAITQNES